MDEKTYELSRWRFSRSGLTGTLQATHKGSGAIVNLSWGNGTIHVRHQPNKVWTHVMIPMCVIDQLKTDKIPETQTP